MSHQIRSEALIAAGLLTAVVAAAVLIGLPETLGHIPNGHGRRA